MGWADETEATSVVSGWLLRCCPIAYRKGEYTLELGDILRPVHRKSAGKKQNEILGQISSGGFFGPNGGERKR